MFNSFGCGFAGSGEGIAKQDAVDAPPACTIGFDNRTASTFDPKDGSECHGISF